MKKWIKTALLTLALGFGALGFAGCTSTPDIDIRVENGYVQYLDENGSWLNVISVEQLKGEDGDNGKQVEFNVTSTHIQWRYIGDSTWINLVSLQEIKGDEGKDGKDGSTWHSGTTYPSTAKAGDFFLNTSENKIYKYNGSSWDFQTDIAGVDGKDGKEVEFNVTETHIQWRYVGSQEWTNLIELSSLKPEYQPETYTVTFDFGASREYFMVTEQYPAEVKIKENQWLSDVPGISPDYKDSFLGWFIKGTNKKIEKYDFVGASVILQPKFDINFNVPAGLYYDSVFIKKWDVLVSENLIKVEDKVVIGYDKKINDDIGDYFHRLDLVIGEDVTIIGDSAFINASEFRSIKIPGNVKELGYSCFYGAYNLFNIILCEGLETISDYAIVGTRLNSLTIPASVKHVGTIFNFDDQSLYFNLDKQFQLSVKRGNKFYDSRNDCNAIIETATNKLIAGCHSTIIPNDVEVIAKNAFSGIEFVEEIELPNTIKVIEDEAFFNSGLTSIIIPSSIESFGKDIFTCCGQLKYITINSAMVYNLIITPKDEYDWMSSAKEIKVLKSIVDEETNENEYLTNSANFTKTEDGEYYVYTKVEN